MYAKLIEKSSFAVELQDRTLDGCEIESEWEGMVKVRHHASGMHLILLRDEGLIVDGSKPLIDELLAPTVDPDYIRISGRTIEIGNYRIEVPAFSIAKFMGCVDGDGKAYVSETEKPRVNINYYDARKVCKAAGGNLIRGSQHLALAMDIMSVDANWSGGKVGGGILRRGLHRGTVSGAQPGTYVSPHADESRNFILPSGDILPDVAGHIYSWMEDDIHGNADGLAGKIPSDSPYLTIGKQFSQAQGMGYRPNVAVDWSGNALIRGGYWLSNVNAGVFRLSNGWPVGDSGIVGFRCTKP